MAVKAKANSPAAAGELTARQRKRKENLKLVKRNYQLYFFLIPAVVFIAVFMYFPLYGLQIAFKNYRSGLGIWGSEWVGLKWFEQFFNSPNFSMLLANTLIISIYSLVVSFPFPIILALILNYVKNLRFKKFAQTVTYMPYFISTVVLVAMLQLFLSPERGLYGALMDMMGVQNPIDPNTSPCSGLCMLLPTFGRPPASPALSTWQRCPVWILPCMRRP